MLRQSFQGFMWDVLYFWNKCKPQVKKPWRSELGLKSACPLIGLRGSAPLTAFQKLKKLSGEREYLWDLLQFFIHELQASLEDGQIHLRERTAAAASLQSCPTLWDPQTAAHQAPPSLGFSRQEHWSGLPFPSPMHESEKWKWSRSVVSDSS